MTNRIKTCLMLAALLMVGCATRNPYEQSFVGVQTTFPPSDAIQVLEVNGTSLAASKDMDYADYDAIGYSTVLAAQWDEAKIAEIGMRIGATVAIVWRSDFSMGSTRHGRGQPRRIGSDGSSIQEPPSKLRGKPLKKHQFQFEVAFLRRVEQGA